MILRGKPEEIPKIVAEYKAKARSSIRRKETETWFKQPFKLRCELETFSSSTCIMQKTCRLL
jgi:hypothetical protein